MQPFCAPSRIAVPPRTPLPTVTSLLDPPCVPQVYLEARLGPDRFLRAYRIMEAVDEV